MKSKIYFSRSSSVQDFLEKILELFQEKLQGRILLKPNLVSGEPYPTTTDPEIFRSLVRLLKNQVELGAGDASAADLVRPSKMLKNHPLAQIAREEGIVFYDFYQERMVQNQSCFGDRLRFSGIPLEYDFIISLPVLKAHINVFFTGALKNQFGYLERRERFRVHFRSGKLEQAIVGINQLAPAHLFIVDFRTTLLNANEVRHGGKIAQGKGIFAGTDPVALDWFGFSWLKEIEPKLFGKSPEEIGYLSLAKKIGLGTSEFELVEL